jgi:hypothetical protein
MEVGRSTISLYLLRNAGAQRSRIPSAQQGERVRRIGVLADERGVAASRTAPRRRFVAGLNT